MREIKEVLSKYGEMHVSKRPSLNRKLGDRFDKNRAGAAN